MSQCRAQVTLSEYIQKYNNSHAASDVVVIACGSDPSVAQSVGGLAARLEESELCNLMAKLTEAVRIGRVKLMEQHAITNNQEQECRSLTEQVSATYWITVTYCYAIPICFCYRYDSFSKLF